MSQTSCPSGTQTITETVSENSQLRLQSPETSRGVRWSNDTIDNEHLGKKSSKCCCIYHKPRTAGESSSESDTSDDDLNPYEKMKKKRKSKAKKHVCEHDQQPSSSAPEKTPQT